MRQGWRKTPAPGRLDLRSDLDDVMFGGSVVFAKDLLGVFFVCGLFLFLFFFCFSAVFLSFFFSGPFWVYGLILLELLKQVLVANLI